LRRWALYIAASILMHVLLWCSLSFMEYGASSEAQMSSTVPVRLVAVQGISSPAAPNPEEPVSKPPPQPVKPTPVKKHPVKRNADTVQKCAPGEAKQPETENAPAASGPAAEMNASQGHKRGPSTARPEDVIKRVKPVYPLISRRKGEEGETVLRVKVDGAGNVESLSVECSSGYEMLDRSAMKAVKAWVFVPASPGELLVPVRFTLVR